MKVKPLFLVMLLPMLASCGTSPNGESHNYQVFTDMNGREVTVDLAHVDRVICLGAGALRYYSYVGDLSKLVGIEKIDTANTFGVGNAIRPYYTANKTLFDSLAEVTLGGPQGQANLDYERIAAAQPNIIISFYDASGSNDIQQRLGVPVVSLKQGAFSVFNTTTIASLELLGNIFSRQSRVQELKTYIESVQSDFASLEMSEEHYYVGAVGNWGSTPFTGTFNKFPVFETAKVHNSLENWGDNPQPGAVKQATLEDAEALVALNPDKVFIDAAGLTAFKNDYNANKDKYSALSAIQNNEVYALLPFNAYFTNLEVQVMSTYYVASIAHPEAFATVNLEAKYNEILNKFVGKKCYSDIVELSSSLGGYQKIDINEIIK